MIIPSTINKKIVLLMILYGDCFKVLQLLKKDCKI